MSSLKEEETVSAAQAKEVGVGELLARRAGELALEKKCEEVKILDLRGLTSVTDYFVIVTADSDRKAKAAAEHIIDELKVDGERPCMLRVWIPCTGFCWTILMLLCIYLCRMNAIFMILNRSGQMHR